MSSDTELEWWKTSLIYQVYPRSFCDTSGDGIGDLKGVTAKLDYFCYLNVGALWLNPFFRSPMRDCGYDVSDYRDVDPMFGTLQDFKELVQQAHERGIKIIIDLVPNHTSDQHDWFERSCRREKPYDDYYIWCDGNRDQAGKPLAPNNWLSQFGGSAWSWHEGRQQFYYSVFMPQQPDLNYRNPAVVKEMKDVVRFWLEFGVDGMRVDALDYLFENPDISKDEPRSDLPDVLPFEFEYNDHIYTLEQPEILDIVQGWREIFDEFQNNDGQSRFMVIETYGKHRWRNRYYVAGGNPFNMDMCLMSAPLTGTNVRALVDREYASLPADGWPTFVLGNHDRKRISSKFGAVYVDALNILLMTLRGTPCFYYGEEIGMQEIDVSFEETDDPMAKAYGPDLYSEYCRDRWRSPMQWDSTQNAGFSSSPSPWLPTHPDYVARNVKAQRDSEHQTSLQLYSRLARLRQDPVFQRGQLLYSVTNRNVFSYVRQLPAGGSDARRYLVVLNVGPEDSNDDYSGSPVNSTRGLVVEATCDTVNEMKDREIGLTELALVPGDGLVIRLLCMEAQKLDGQAIQYNILLLYIEFPYKL